MNILMIGGTRFLGRALVESALARGHTLTLFNRGQSNPGLFPDLEHIYGDRDGDLDRLAGRRWDVVIDTCGYFPRLVRASAAALAESVGLYVFISTLSVYADFSQPGTDESGALATMDDETVETITGETYGPLKVLCEQAVTAVMGPERTLIVRPGLIVGPYDASDRFTYWPWRVAQGGEVLAPGRPETPVQIIDVRDLADWTVAMAERGETGFFNATGPRDPLSMGALLELTRVTTGAGADFTWVPDDFLVAHEVGAFVEMPLWIPGPEAVGFGSFSIDRAKAAGLTFRSVADTVRDTLAFANSRPDDHPWRAGLTREREAELLAAWHAQAG